MHSNFSRKLIAAARSSGALSGVAFDGDRTPEQASAFAIFLAACAATDPVTDAPACYLAASAADPVKRERKPNGEKPADAPKPEATAKPEKPSKPHADAKADDYAERVRIVAELRASVSRLYNGPSLAVRSNPKRVAASVYSDLCDTPKHRTTLDRVSVRDESALAEIIKRGDAGGAFDPVALNLDAGIFSRLRSVGFIERAPASCKLPFRLSKPGAAHARKAAGIAA